MVRGWDILEKGRAIKLERKAEEEHKAKAARLREWIENGKDPWEEDDLCATVCIASSVLVVPPGLYNQAQNLLNGNQPGANMHASVVSVPLTATYATVWP